MLNNFMPLRCGGSLCKVQDDKRLLPLIGEGWDEEFPAKALFFIVILNSGAKRNVIQNPLQVQRVLKLILTHAICPTMRL